MLAERLFDNYIDVIPDEVGAAHMYDRIGTDIDRETVSHPLRTVVATPTTADRAHPPRTIRSRNRETYT